MTDDFRRLLGADRRRVAGLMSGTSLDGVDAVVATLQGSGRGMEIHVEGSASQSYPEPLRRLLVQNSAPETSSVRDLSQLNARLAHVYADAVHAAVADAGLKVRDLDLVGSHGQTVHHVPEPADCAGRAVASTLQIGDPSVLATLLGVPVVGDFRPPDMALGGQGAPLVPYFDYVYFADAREARGLLNLGGIGNLTVLPPAPDLADVYAFDTGPANMPVDLLAQRLFAEPFDRDGHLAAQGDVDDTVLAELLQRDAYLAQPPPKSTGRERYGAPFVDRLAERMGVDRPHDVIATATAFSAAAIYAAYARFVRDRHPLDVVIAAGGGTRNSVLMRRLSDHFAPIPVRTADAYGLAADLKEALCFAVLAHEYLNGVPTSLPSVTGASRPALLGKLCVPYAG